jgi:hypothetical protein
VTCGACAQYLIILLYKQGPTRLGGTPSCDFRCTPQAPVDVLFWIGGEALIPIGLGHLKFRTNVLGFLALRW